MNTTFRDIQDNILAQVSKSDTAARGRAKTYINMGYYDFVTRALWPFRQKTGTLILSAGTQEYDLSTSFTDMEDNNILSVALQSPNQTKLPFTDYTQLRASEPDLTATGVSVPQSYYVKSGKIGFWPSPAGAYEVAVDYMCKPTELSADTDEPIIPVEYREALMHYGLSLEHKYDTDFDFAQAAMNRYEQIVVLARENLLSQPNDTGVFRVMGPADSRYWL